MKNNYNHVILILNIIICLINIYLLLNSFSQKLRCKKKKIDNTSSSIDKQIDTTKDKVSDFPKKLQTKHGLLLISKATEVRLVSEFKKAHNSNFFLEKGVDLKELAKRLCTNQRYASHIVNIETGLDFNNYVQHSRINYLIKKIEMEPDLLKLKFSVLAESIGFSSSSKFAAVFKAILGVTPSEYFQKKQNIG